jgi:hypothetical protein
MYSFPHSPGVTSLRPELAPSGEWPCAAGAGRGSVSFFNLWICDFPIHSTQPHCVPGRGVGGTAFVYSCPKVTLRCIKTLKDEWTSEFYLLFFLSVFEKRKKPVWLIENQVTSHHHGWAASSLIYSYRGPGHPILCSPLCDSVSTFYSETQRENLSIYSCSFSKEDLWLVWQVTHRKKDPLLGRTLDLGWWEWLPLGRSHGKQQDYDSVAQSTRCGHRGSSGSSPQTEATLLADASTA